MSGTATRATATATPRWAMSFADLCLVLLAFLLLLHAHRGNPAAVGAGIRAAFGSRTPSPTAHVAAAMFEPGEAVLRASARSELATIGHAAAAAGRGVRVDSVGSDGGGSRFDGWELAAARAAAAARGVSAGGLDPARVDVRVAGTRDATSFRGQRLTFTTV